MDIIDLTWSSRSALNSLHFTLMSGEEGIKKLPFYTFSPFYIALYYIAKPTNPQVDFD